MLGAGAGLLNLGLFHALSGAYRPTSRGRWCGAGSGMDWDVSPPRCSRISIHRREFLLVMVIAPAAFAVLFLGGSTPPRLPGSIPAFKQAFADFEVREPSCSPCCCSFSSETNGRWRDGCRCC